MGENQPSPSSLCGKRQRSSDEASDDERKRRKGHHHRRHHRHRHHSKRGRYRDEEENEDDFEERRLEHASVMKPVDYEREEGEILEEDEEVGNEGPGFAMEADSEVESGEIRTDVVPPAPKKVCYFFCIAYHFSFSFLNSVAAHVSWIILVSLAQILSVTKGIL